MAKQGDLNLRVASATDEGFVWYSPVEAPMVLTGFPWRETNGNYCRLPMDTMATLRENLQWVAWQPSGGMLRFKTNSARVAINVTYDRREHFMHANTHGQESGFDCYVGAGKRCAFHRTLAPQKVATRQLYTQNLPSSHRAAQDLRLYFPLLNPVRQLSIGLDEGASLEKPAAFKGGRIAFYGSSITQGFCCSRPGLTYPAVVCRERDAELINLGFGGNAWGDLAVADAIAELELDAFVYDYDHNAKSVQWLKDTHEPFFKRLRKKRPDLPILVVSSPVYRKAPEFFGQREAIIKRTVTRAKQRGDKRVKFLAGKSFFPSGHWQDCTVDNLHPNDYGFRLMANGVNAALSTLLR